MSDPGPPDPPRRRLQRLRFRNWAQEHDPDAVSPAEWWRFGVALVLVGGLVWVAAWFLSTIYSFGWAT